MFSASSVSASPSDAKAVHAVRGRAARMGRPAEPAASGRPPGPGAPGRPAGPDGGGRGRAALRPVTALLLSGLVTAATLAGTGTAAADDPGRHQGGAAAVLDGLKTFDSAVLRMPGENGAPDRTQELPAGLFEMTVDGGGKLRRRPCIDLHNPTQDQAKYLETPWAETSLGANRNAGKIRWILQHSYPQVDDLAALAEAAGTGPHRADRRRGHPGRHLALLDDADVTASDKQAEKLADWLQKRARNVAEPRASLTLEPAAVSGRAGERLGPVIVRTDADQVSVSPPVDAAASGISVTDEKGVPVTSATDQAPAFSRRTEGQHRRLRLADRPDDHLRTGRPGVRRDHPHPDPDPGRLQRVHGLRTGHRHLGRDGRRPALTARKNCAAGGVDITAANQGDEPFTFELGGTEHTVAAGTTETVTIPVAEDQAYDFTITGPGGFRKNFTGVLDCATSGSVIAAEADRQSDDDTGVGTQDARQSSFPPRPAPPPPAWRATSPRPAAPSTTPMIAALAVGLLVIGGCTLFVLRRKEAHQHAE
ncbi:TQXA domain-containing protein OS=Streptomyces microflavus OX=1919 GN=Smic_24970 PE=4 SV=1 [Streptomyces microflavus]